MAWKSSFQRLVVFGGKVLGLDETFSYWRLGIHARLLISAPQQLSCGVFELGNGCNSTYGKDGIL
jgi:hypothetical protein